MQLKVNQQAPDFTITDLSGQIIQIKKTQDQKIFLAFHRNAGCPVCNLRFHELNRNASLFSASNIKVILVYESTKDKMLEYLGNEKYPFHFVADPENRLYNLYSIERSLGKVMKSMWNGIMSKAMAGKKLFTRPIKQDGHTDTIPAEFLINTDGSLSIAHYGNFIGDHISINEIVGTAQAKNKLSMV
jgi:peroxiredoxin Q/BCP